ncbi:MAG: hypothetical protein RJQ00_13070 [Vicingaceae bacterium]
MSKRKNKTRDQQENGQQLCCDFEKLKLVYDKVAEHHKYYLSWRRYLLTGYFTVVAALSYSSYTLFNSEYSYWTFAITFFIGLISLLIYFLDKRNQGLYHISQRVGSNIEQELFKHYLTNDKSYLDATTWNEDGKKDGKGLFFTLDNSHKNSVPTHSTIIYTLYLTTTFLAFVITVFMIIYKTLPTLCANI